MTATTLAVDLSGGPRDQLRNIAEAEGKLKVIFKALAPPKQRERKKPVPPRGEPIGTDTEGLTENTVLMVPGVKGEFQFRKVEKNGAITMHGGAPGHTATRTFPADQVYRV